MASRVLLATLAVPIPVSLSETEKHLEYDEIVREKSRRLANLLGLQIIPTRASLVNDMVRSKTTPHSFSLDLGYLPFDSTWKNWKFWLEYQMVHTIPFGILQKTWGMQ